MKREHTFVFYTVTGEHLTIDCDRLKTFGKEIGLYNIDPGDEDEHMELMAVFNKDKVVGWEQVR